MPKHILLQPSNVFLSYHYGVHVTNPTILVSKSDATNLQLVKNRFSFRGGESLGEWRTIFFPDVKLVAKRLKDGYIWSTKEVFRGRFILIGIFVYFYTASIMASVVIRKNNYMESVMVVKQIENLKKKTSFAKYFANSSLYSN